MHPTVRKGGMEKTGRWVYRIIWSLFIMVWVTLCIENKLVDEIRIDTSETLHIET